jgi:hypothetical protein
MSPIFRERGWPRCWIAGYDAWHLAAPALLAVAITLIAKLPYTPPPPPAPPPLPAPVVSSPAPNAHFAANAVPAVTGTAPAGTWARFYFGRVCVAQQQVGLEGRFSFQPAGLPSGTNTVYVQIVRGRQSSWSPPVAFVVDPPPAPPRRGRRRN